MRTTLITVEIEARANSSESRIREAVLQNITDAFAFGHAQSTEDGKPVHVRVTYITRPEDPCSTGDRIV